MAVPAPPEPSTQATAPVPPPILGLLRPGTASLIAASILMIGNGLLGMLIPLRADAEHFTR
jgi:hypothetical protein